MKTDLTKSLILPAETRGETLARLSANIATLSDLIDEAESRGRITLAGLFTRERAAKVTEAREKIARARALLATSAAAVGHPNTRVPVGKLPLQPEARQWQRAINEGWKQEV